MGPAGGDLVRGAGSILPTEFTEGIYGVNLRGEFPPNRFSTNKNTPQKAHHLGVDQGPLPGLLDRSSILSISFYDKSSNISEIFQTSNLSSLQVVTLGLLFLLDQKGF